MRLTDARVHEIASARDDDACRAARRLRRDRRDGRPARAGARGPVPRPGVRRDPPSARRVGGGPAHRRQPDEGPPRGRRSTRSSSRACARRCGCCAARAKLHYCDLLGHPIEAVARVSGMAARMTPGSRPPLNSAYFKRMEAIEFAVRFDDGVGRGLHDADIVLVGVSRTSKTPLSIYLGYLGHKSANVPVVKGIEPPPQLFEIDLAKIVGLTIDPNRLAEIRRARVRTMGAREPPVRGVDGDLRGARAGGEAASPARLSRDRHLRALDRGDGAPRAARSRGAADHSMKNEKGSVPLRYWVLWWTAIVIFDFVFYVLLTPIWIGLRVDRVARGVPRSSPALGGGHGCTQDARRRDRHRRRARASLARRAVPAVGGVADRSGRLVRDRSRHLPAR